MSQVYKIKNSKKPLEIGDIVVWNIRIGEIPSVYKILTLPLSKECDNFKVLCLQSEIQQAINKVYDMYVEQLTHLSYYKWDTRTELSKTMNKVYEQIVSGQI